MTTISSNNESSNKSSPLKLLHIYLQPPQKVLEEIDRILKPNGIVFITVSANRYKRKASKFKIPEPRTYVPLDGEEKGLVNIFLSTDLNATKPVPIQANEGKEI